MSMSGVQLGVMSTGVGSPAPGSESVRSQAARQRGQERAAGRESQASFRETQTHRACKESLTS